MRENLARKTHSNTFRSLCQQQWELHRQGDRFLVAPVIAEFPFRRLRIENHVEREFRKASLDVSTCSGIITRQDIAPVALAVNQQFLLSQLHQGILDTGIAMRMILHRTTHNVRYLIETPIIHLLHGMEDASLHWLETIHDVRHGTFQNHVGGIVQKPVLIHATQVVRNAILISCWVIVRLRRHLTSALRCIWRTNANVFDIVFLHWLSFSFFCRQRYYFFLKNTRFHPINFAIRTFSSFKALRASFKFQGASAVSGFKALRAGFKFQGTSC